MYTDRPQILRPIPLRPQGLLDNDGLLRQSPSLLLSASIPRESPSRTQSVLNLTSSTLWGIYAPTGYDEDKELPSTSWGTASEQIAAVRKPPAPRRNLLLVSTSPHPRTAPVSLVFRSLLLSGLGMLYGLLVRHLHDDRQLAPFHVEGIIKPSQDGRYLLFWGIAGVGLGSLLPWIDTFWEQRWQQTKITDSRLDVSPTSANKDMDGDKSLIADWTPVVRSVGAFMGIAYAIRKLPWASTLQAALTLALVNPVLWYIIDRSKTGFVLSTAVGATGTVVLMALYPDMLPSPATSPRNSTIEHHMMHGLGGYVSRESIEGVIWLLSVLFCSCVCFGNIGRRLALSRGGLDRAEAKSYQRRVNDMQRSLFSGK